MGPDSGTQNYHASTTYAMPRLATGCRARPPRFHEVVRHLMPAQHVSGAVPGYPCAACEICLQGVARSQAHLDRANDGGMHRPEITSTNFFRGITQDGLDRRSNQTYV